YRVEVVRAMGGGVGDDGKIPLIAGRDVTEIDDHVGVAIGSLLFMPKSDRVPDFVADRTAIPGVRAYSDKLLAASHADGTREATGESRVLQHGDEVRMTGDRFDKIQIRPRGPLGHAIA